MLRKAIKLIFVDGALRHPGEVFEASRAWDHTAPADGQEIPDPQPAPLVPAAKLNRKQIMAELAAAGVSFKATAPTDDLAGLLASVKASGAPAASAAAPKDEVASGTGNQNVI